MDFVELDDCERRARAPCAYEWELRESVERNCTVCSSLRRAALL